MSLLELQNIPPVISLCAGGNLIRTVPVFIQGLKLSVTHFVVSATATVLPFCAVNFSKTRFLNRNGRNRIFEVQEVEKIENLGSAGY